MPFHPPPPLPVDFKLQNFHHSSFYHYLLLIQADKTLPQKFSHSNYLLNLNPLAIDLCFSWLYRPGASSDHDGACFSVLE